MEEHRITVLTTAKYEEGDYEQVYSNNRIVVDTKDLIILDTGATVSIFGNLNLVENVHVSEPISVTGISNQKVTIAKKGNCTALFGMEVYVDDSIHINIISFAELDKLVRIERSSTGFISEPVIWHLVDNLYMYSLKCDCADLKRDVYKLVKTNVERIRKKRIVQQRAIFDEDRKIVG